ncbi:collagen-like protein [Bacillaceae bacterium S4-13-56]
MPGNQGGFPEFPEFPEFPGGGFLGNPPFNPPGLPPSGPSPGGQGQGQPPTTPPPSFVPQSQPQGQVQLYAVDPGAIRRCLFKFTYVWLERGRRAFWFYPTYVGRRSIAGYRWTGFMWVYYGIDLDRIESFQCY